MHGANGWRLPPFVSCRLHLRFYFKDRSTHYSQKLVGLQTGAADQRTVHAMPAEECRGVIRYDAAAILNGQPGIDGVLIGGASLKADEFLAIVHAAVAEILAEKQPA